MKFPAMRVISSDFEPTPQLWEPYFGAGSMLAYLARSQRHQGGTHFYFEVQDLLFTRHCGVNIDNPEG